MKVKDSTKDFVPAPEGLHQAVCVDVVDKGDQENPYKPGEKIHKCQIRWQIEERTEDDKPFLVLSWYTVSLHKKSNLRRDLEAWRGQRFTPIQLEGFELDDLLGKGCQLQVIHKTTENGTFANVQSIVPLGKKMKAMTIEDYIREQDRDNGDAPVKLKPEPEPADDEDLPF